MCILLKSYNTLIREECANCLEVREFTMCISIWTLSNTFQHFRGHCQSNSFLKILIGSFSLRQPSKVIFLFVCLFCNFSRGDIHSVAWVWDKKILEFICLLLKSYFPLFYLSLFLHFADENFLLYLTLSKDRTSVIHEDFKTPS